MQSVSYIYLYVVHIYDPSNVFTDEKHDLCTRFFLAMLFALIVYDGISSSNMRNDLLLKEDRIHFHNIVIKAGHTQYRLNIDSFHYVVFMQPHDHEERLKMLDDMDTSIIVFAGRVQILP